MPAPTPAAAVRRFRVATLGVAGVGLIGGSVAKAALARGVAGEVVGFGRNQSRLNEAVAAGVITRGSIAPADAAGVDLLVVCTPVGRIVEDVRRFAAAMRPDAIITDAGSVKGPICAALRDEARFVGSHPLAGGEKSGWEHADADLFDDRVAVVCPGDREGVAVTAFWESLGSRAVWMTPVDHDARLARTSHLPHALAAALCLAADGGPNGDGRLTSTGFASTTRTAAGDPGLWADIFHANAAAAGDAVDRLTDRLGEFRAALAAADRTRIEAWLADAAHARQTLTNC